MAYKLAIFDLDGVITDTAKYHYLAWKSLADRLGFDFTPAHNERLKGVSRGRSLEILLEVGGLGAAFSDEEKSRMMAEKNDLYLTYINQLTPQDLLPGAADALARLKASGVLVALGSASKNAPLILDKLGIAALFDAVSDGNLAEKPKPDPQVFLLAAEALNVPPSDCVVFEDAQAGVDAALAAGMAAIGVGKPENLAGANAWIIGLDKLTLPITP